MSAKKNVYGAIWSAELVPKIFCLARVVDNFMSWWSDKSLNTTDADVYRGVDVAMVCSPTSISFCWATVKLAVRIRLRWMCLPRNKRICLPSDSGPTPLVR